MKYNLFKTKKCGILSEAIGGIFNVGSTALGGWMASKEAENEREWNAEQAQINRDFQRDERIAAQEYNLDMWNMNNEYNSPAAQLERAKAAGINPNTLFGGTTPVASQALSTTPMSGAQATSNIAGALGSQYIGVASALGMNTANMLNTLAETNTKEYWLSYDQMTEKQRKDILIANADNILKDIEVKDVNIDTAKTILSNLASLKEQELLNLRATARKIEADIRKTDTDINSIEASIERDDRLADASISATEASINRDDAVAEADIALKGSMQSLNNQQEAESVERTKTQVHLNDFTDAVGAPPGTPEYLFVKKLYDEKKLSEFLDNVYIPLERSHWKPRDYSVDNKYLNNTNTEYFFDFQPSKGIVNPATTDYQSPDDYWEHYYKNRTESTNAKSKWYKRYNKK